MTTPARRRPHCRTCKLPMAGHNKRECRPFAESRAIPSPPTTPAREYDYDYDYPEPGPSNHHLQQPHPPQHHHTSTRSPPTRSPPTPLVRAPNGAIVPLPLAQCKPLPAPGYYHRKNPNWQSVTPPQRPTPLARVSDDDDDRASMVPTVLDQSNEDWEEQDDDYHYQAGGTAIVKREQTAHPPEIADDSISLRIARSRPSVNMVYDLVGPASPPLAGLYPASSSQLGLIRRGARALGLHMGAIRTPRVELKEEDLTHEGGMIYNRARKVAAAPSFWAVLGRDKRAVEHICLLQRERAHAPGQSMNPISVSSGPGPGGMASGVMQEHYNLGTPRGLVFSQLVFAVVAGGLIMFWILSLV